MFLKIFMLVSGLRAAETVTSLDALLSRIPAGNPEVQAALAEADRAEADALSSASWPAPVLSAELMRIPAPSLNLGGYGRHRFELSQDLPFFGRASAAGKVAAHEVEFRRAVVKQVLEDKILEARNAYYAWMASEIRAAALRESLASFRALEGRMAQSRLNALMGTDPGSALPAPNVALQDLMALNAPSEEEVWKAALRSNPQLKAAEHEVLHAASAAGLAKSGWLPDLMFEAGFEQDRDGGMQEASLKAGISLPWLWFSKQAGMNRVAQEDLRAAEAAKQKVTLALREELREHQGGLGAVVSALKIAALATLPLAEKAQKQALAGFRSGGIGADQSMQALMAAWRAADRVGVLAGQAGAQWAGLQHLMADYSSRSKELGHGHD